MKSSVLRIGLVPHGFEVSSKLNDDGNIADTAHMCRDFGDDIHPYILGLFLYDTVCEILNDEESLRKKLEKYEDEPSVLNLKKYGALLHSAWKPGEARDKIDGCWAEDFSHFEITVPYQLRDLLVDLQNELSTEYKSIVERGR